MQNLCTEICQLSSLLEVELVNGLRLVDHTWVVIMHTVDVRPDLNLLGIDGSTNQRSGIVRATTLQIVNLTVSIAADKALRNVHLQTLILLHNGSQLFFNIHGVRF